MTEATRKINVFFNVNGFFKYSPDDLCVLLGIPDEHWEEIIQDPSKLITVMEDALIAALRCVAKEGDDLRDWIDTAAEDMKKRIQRSNNSLVKVVPMDMIETEEETRH